MAHRGQIRFLSIRKTLIYGRADQPASPPPKANTHRKHRCLCAAAGRGIARVAFGDSSYQVGFEMPDFTLKRILIPSPDFQL